MCSTEEELGELIRRHARNFEERRFLDIEKLKEFRRKFLLITLWTPSVHLQFYIGPQILKGRSRDLKICI